MPNPGPLQRRGLKKCEVKVLSLGEDPIAIGLGEASTASFLPPNAIAHSNFIQQARGVFGITPFMVVIRFRHFYNVGIGLVQMSNQAVELAENYKEDIDIFYITPVI